MKKITAVILALLFVLSACGTDTFQNTREGYKTITAKEVKEMIDREDNIILLDVRSEQEHKAGHIPGSILIPGSELAQRAPELLQDKNARIVVYCQSGRRSKSAANTLLELGYSNVYDLGGINNWTYEIKSK